MADNKQEEDTKTEVEASKTDFVQLVKDAVQGHGSATFLRVNLEEKVSVEGLELLNKEYETQGYEVFSNGKSVLLLKH